MSASLEVRILLLADQEAILAFEKSRSESRYSDPMEREMSGWSARWRPEALAHYLPQGWSFGVFLDGRLQAYALAQPFVFFRGMTQTLWVEHVGYHEVPAALQVLDVVHRWARDKHLQCVVTENDPELQEIFEQWPAAKAVPRTLLEAKSARY